MACAPRDLMYSRHLKTFHDVYLGLHLFVRFTSLLALFIWTSGNVMTIVSITHTVILSKQEVSRRRVALKGISAHKTVGRKSKCKLNFFSMYFVRNSKEIHLSFKNSEK